MCLTFKALTYFSLGLSMWLSPWLFCIIKFHWQYHSKFLTTVSAGSKSSGHHTFIYQYLPKQTPEGTGSSLSNKDKNPPINGNHSEDWNAPMTRRHSTAYNDTAASQHHRLMKASSIVVKMLQSTSKWLNCERNN